MKGFIALLLLAVLCTLVSSTTHHNDHPADIEMMKSIEFSNAQSLAVKSKLNGNPQTQKHALKTPMEDEDDDDDDEDDEDGPWDALTHRPNCRNDQSLWYGKRIRHPMFVDRFWSCDRWITQLNHCPRPLWFQESLQTCIFSWRWHDETEDSEEDSEEDDEDSEETHCPEPSCEGFHRFLMQPHDNPRFYWQCSAAGPVKMHCGFTKLLFSYRHQDCVRPDLREDMCPAE